MEKVVGFGGFFFRSRDPEALAAWYEAHLGISRVPRDFDSQPWTPAGGPTVFAPFPAETDYFGDPARAFMLNFRVSDMDAMMAQLRAAGIEVTEGDPMPIGRFARLRDPEGNPIELWEPKAP
ncbi:Glyoxalase-like domain protein [Pseudoruegeria aquimaris]|uniref:Glyoxalase-like domain protein n=1 Tax=Pseudoruegeria aquimaris TaxID=393663 RepID=A0A1Y5S575_9RHOB|nr:VOC family protein [Pseudoruegeria aquimaris]SLN30056.1 Glyoxalase-like domain protein [Pseudoruegeria aquimaris]